MAIDYQALKNELTLDPVALGYAAASDAQAADLLNLPRVGVIIRRDDISSSELLEAIDSRDFEPSPNVLHVAWFESATQGRQIRLVDDAGVNTRVLGNLRRLLISADTNGSRARLDAIANRQGTRAEELFGRNTLITHSDVANARQLP